MSINDYVKYLTETFIKHLEMPKAERKQLRLDRKDAKPPAMYQWFGLVPISLSMLFRKRG